LAVIIFFMPLGAYILNFGFYDRLYRENGVYQALDAEDVKTMTFRVYDFFLYRGELEGQVRSADPAISYAASFTGDEISHMKDVRDLIRNIFIMYGGAAVLLAVSLFLALFTARGHSLKKTGLIFIWSSSAVLSIFTVLFILGTNFYSLFDNFHLVFFPQGNYMFSEGALLISMFPFGFFYHFFIRLAAGSSITAAVILILGIIFTLTGYRKGRLANEKRPHRQ
jgi:hypothetical protein